MASAPAQRPGGFVRQTLLGSEAVYELLEGDDTVVRAEVVHAPGLARGTRIRLLANATAAMERIDLTGPTHPTRPIAPSVAAPCPRATVPTR